MVLEALIAILIFSIGVVSMIALQEVAIKNGASAAYRSEASFLSNQIIGEIWTDQANIQSYALNSSNSGMAVCPNGGNTASYKNVQDWLTNSVFRLPGSQALQQSITIGANNIVTVMVCWKGPKEAQTHVFTSVAQIN